MGPRCAILIPSFNCERTIAETLQSVQAQGEDLARIAAVYVSDDASKDRTAEVAKGAWATQSPPLHVLSRDKNGGERANLNQVIRELQSDFDWVFILHADDIAKPAWLRIMLSRIDHADSCVGSICSSWDDWMPDGSIIRGEDNETRDIQKIEASAASVRRSVMVGCWWHISGCAIRIRAFREIGEFGEDLPQLGDWDWLLRSLRNGWGVEYIPRALILYRNHAASVSSISFKTDRDIRESLRVLRLHLTALSSTDIFAFHIRRLGFCVRRLGRAVLERNAERIPQIVVTGKLVVHNLVVCLFGRTTSFSKERKREFPV